MKTKRVYSKLVMISMFVFILNYGIVYGQNSNEMEVEMSTVKSNLDPDMQWGGCPPFMPEGCGIAVLNGDPTKNNMDIFFKVPANSDIPRHWHTSAERMILVSGKLHVTYDGEEEIIMNTGSYAYGPPSKPHVARCGDEGPCVLFIAFEEPLDAFPMVEKK